MKEVISNSILITLTQNITLVTKNYKPIANAASKLMDTANGGVNAHGGYHRVFGGHSVCDLSMWKKLGAKFPKELAIDSFTKNGIPLPGVEALLKAGKISPKTAQTWGSMNIGKMGATLVGSIDSGMNIYKFKKQPDIFKEKENNIALKGTFKFVSGVSTCNIPLAALGVIDVAMVINSKIDQNLDFDFDEGLQFS